MLSTDPLLAKLDRDLCINGILPFLIKKDKFFLSFLNHLKATHNQNEKVNHLIYISKANSNNILPQQDTIPQANFKKPLSQQVSKNESKEVKQDLENIKNPISQENMKNPLSQEDSKNISKELKTPKFSTSNRPRFYGRCLSYYITVSVLNCLFGYSKENQNENQSENPYKNS